MNAFRLLRLPLSLSLLRCRSISYSDEGLPLSTEGSLDTGNVTCSDDGHLYNTYWLGSASLGFDDSNAVHRRLSTSHVSTTEGIDPPDFRGSRRCGTPAGIKGDYQESYRQARFMIPPATFCHRHTSHLPTGTFVPTLRLRSTLHCTSFAYMSIIHYGQRRMVPSTKASSDMDEEVKVTSDVLESFRSFRPHSIPSTQGLDISL
ncbi:hypothetical protein H4582DRAFT_1956857 [Lactarius indigo]|nr:hypothetical protein H4582DRAFT_1956857 [Lactarius indigo]